MEYFNFVFWRTRIFNRTIISWRNERAKNLEIFLKNLKKYFWSIFRFIQKYPTPSEASLKKSITALNKRNIWE